MALGGGGARLLFVTMVEIGGLNKGQRQWCGLQAGHLPLLEIALSSDCKPPVVESRLQTIYTSVPLVPRQTESGKMSPDWMEYLCKFVSNLQCMYVSSIGVGM